MSRKLLVVDDEPSILETTRYILEAEGFQVLTARDGEEALSVIRRERPRAVLLDLMLPKLDGYAVCRTIRADADLADTYVMIVTAKGLKADETLGYEAGANAFMRKPVEDDLLLARLASAFEGA